MNFIAVSERGQKMSDYISRQAAFEALEKRGVSTTNISRVPVADVRENVRGEWIRRKDTIQCSQCKAKWIDHTYLIETFRFCPNCGADMRPISALSENVEIVSNLKRGES